MEGIIEKWIEDKNFGFIDIGGEKGLFFHKNEVAEGYNPKEGDKVEFEKTQGDKGPMAIKVRKAGEAPKEEAAVEEAKPEKDEKTKDEE